MPNRPIRTPSQIVEIGGSVSQPVSTSTTTPEPVNVAASTGQHRQLCRHVVAVEPGHAYRVEAVIQDAREYVHVQAALLSLRFLGQNRQPVNTAIAGWTFSKRFDRWVMYLPSCATSDHQYAVSRTFIAPQGAREVELIFFQWQGSSSMAVADRPTLGRTSPSVQTLRAYESICMRTAEKAVLAAFELEPKSASFLNYAFQFAQERQSVSILRLACRHMLMSGARGINQLAASLKLEELQELDPNWLPRIVGLPVQKRTLRGKHYCIAHFIQNLADTHDTLIPYSHACPAPRQICVTPMEYTLPSIKPSAAPWVQTDCNGITSFQLSGITHSAQAQLGRTQAMALDALLSMHICRDNNVAVIHAHAGKRGYDLALRGLAAAAKLRIPLVYQPYLPFSPLDANTMESNFTSELSMLRHDQEVRCMQQADAIIVNNTEVKKALVSRGINESKIFVVPMIVGTAIAPLRCVDKPPAERLTCGIVADALSPDALARFCSEVPMPPGMQLAIYGNTQTLSICRTIMARRPSVGVAYVDCSVTAQQFLADLSCLVLSGPAAHWTEEHQLWWTTHAMAKRVPILGYHDNDSFHAFVWHGHKLVISTSQETLEQDLIAIKSREEKIETMVERAHDWVASTRSPESAAFHYQAAYDYAVQQSRSKQHYQGSARACKPH